MKTAVSIPDDVFSEAELLAQQMKTSRSALYARALAAFIGTHAQDRVTQSMNDALEELDAAPDAFAGSAARRVFDRVEW